MAEGRKKLYRSKDNRWLVGVCGGIGDYFDMDATVIRVIFVLTGQNRMGHRGNFSIQVNLNPSVGVPTSLFNRE